MVSPQVVIMLFCC